MKNLDLKTILIGFLSIIILAMGITIVFQKSPKPKEIHNEELEKVKVELELKTKIDSIQKKI